MVVFMEWYCILQTVLDNFFLYFSLVNKNYHITWSKILTIPSTLIMLHNHWIYII
jgi:hypothetical protein